MQDPTLVLLAAGLSKRFGRSKQETPVGPDGEVLHDYNIFDALSSGFGRIAFVVRSDNEAAIRDAFESRFGYSVPTSYVRQMRPLGTGHAVAGIRGLVEGPFAVCNTDDLYGREAFAAVLARLRETRAGMPIQGCVVGYRLDATLSEHGGVARAVCRVDDAGRLSGIDEILDIQPDDGGTLVGRTPEGEPVMLTGEERVSMNLWGFGPGMAEALMRRYEKWTYEGAREEYRLSSAVDDMVKEGLMEIDLLPGPDEAWIGMTHAADVHRLHDVLEKAVVSGRYPASLKATFRG
jgi:dTDP-glucose pyrophosphorylase